MRAPFIAALLLVAGAAPASAELWRFREGRCGEWRSRWDVRQEQSGAWAGRLERVHVGGRCEAPTGEVSQGSVRAALLGELFFATRFAGEDRRHCNYFGRLEGEVVRGVAFCARDPRPQRFVLRFPGNDPQGRAAPPLQQDESYNERSLEQEGEQTESEDGAESFYRRLPENR